MSVPPLARHNRHTWRIVTDYAGRTMAYKQCERCSMKTAQVVPSGGAPCPGYPLFWSDASWLMADGSVLLERHGELTYTLLPPTMQQPGGPFAHRLVLREGEYYECPVCGYRTDTVPQQPEAGCPTGAPAQRMAWPQTNYADEGS